MGTANFYNKNASRIYACEIEEHWDFDDLKENLRWYFDGMELPKDVNYFNMQGGDGARNFYGSYIGEFIVKKSWYEIDIIVQVKAIARSGYYAGCNLDWEAGVLIPRANIPADEIDRNEIIGYFNDYGMTLKQAVRYAPYTEKWIAHQVADLTTIVEKGFEIYSQPLRLIAQASNGEAFYEKA